MISNRVYIWALVFLIGVRIIMVIGIMQGFPDMQNIQGSDRYEYFASEPEFFRLAESLAKFRPVVAYTTLGFSIFLVPFIWIFQAKTIEDILFPVTLFNSILLFGISVILVASIAKILSNENRKVALLSAGLWVFLPYLIYFIVLLNPRLSCIDIAQKRTFYLMWTTMLENTLFSFLIILGVYTFIGFLKHREKISYSFLVGILFGFASLVNAFTSAVVGISFIVAFISIRRIKAFIYSAVTFGVFSIPQLFYNWYFNGSPFNLLAMQGRILFYNGRAIPLFALSNIIFSTNRIRERFDITTLSILIILTLLMLLSIIYILKKKDKSKVLIIWIVPHLCFIAVYSNFYFSILECIEPVLPAIIIMFSIVAVDISDYLLNLRYKIKFKIPKLLRRLSFLF